MKLPKIMIYKDGDTDRPTVWFYIRNVAIGLTAIGLVVLYGLEMGRFNNIFNVRTLAWISVLIGIIISGFLAWKYQPNTSTILEKFQWYVFVVVLSAVFSPLLASLSNRWLAYDSNKPKAYEVYKVRGYKANRFGMIKGEKMSIDGFYVFLIKDDKIVRITTKKAKFGELQKGDSIYINIRKGFWGYEWYED